MAEIKVLQLMDMIEQNPSINNYQSRWRELRELLEKQALFASQHRVQRTAEPLCQVCLMPLSQHVHECVVPSTRRR